MDVKISNVATTCNLCCPLDLNIIHDSDLYTQYNSRRFNGLILKLFNPRGTVLIFSSGKLVSVGCKSVKESKSACRKTAKFLRRLGFPAKMKEFAVRNVVASMNTPFRINVPEFVKWHPLRASYEPELFPAMKYRVPDSKMVATIFQNGKVFVTGGKSEEHITEEMGYLYVELSLFSIE